MHKSITHLLLFTAALLVGTAWTTACPGQDADLEELYEREARRAAPRDAFPVLNQPEGVPAAEADAHLSPDDWIIGVVQGDEAKAYPVALMGVHELANDVVGETPIAVSW